MVKRLMFISSVSSVAVLLLLAFTNRDKPVRDRFSQTAPQGMLLIESDSMLPFYISVIEEPNINWNVYIKWLEHVYMDYPQIYKNALPQDTMTGVWQYYNDPFLDNYFEHPSYQWYPVVGVSWNQVHDYMEWKTDRLNEIILNKAEIYELNMRQIVDENQFSTTAYLVNQYDPSKIGRGENEPRDFRTRKGHRDVEVKDGVLFANYRLPTEQEWEQGLKYIQDKSHAGIIRSSLKKANPLNFWLEYYYIKPEVQGTDNPDPVSESTNFTGGVSEWLLDNYIYKPVALENNYEILIKNGWRQFNNADRATYDSYGEIEEKDSCGRVSFMLAGATNIRQPLYLSRPVLEAFIAVKKPYKNPLYGKDSLYVINYLKTRYSYWDWELKRGYGNVYDPASPRAYDPSDFSSFLRYMKIEPYKMTLDSVNIYTEYMKTDDALRKIKTGNYRSPGQDIKYLPQNFAEPLVGFRCVLPYLGLPVMKGKKVNW